MRSTTLKRWRTALGGLALGAMAATGAAAQSRVVLPAGSVLIVRTTTPLQSSTAKVGQTFNTRVDESIGVDEFTVIPAGSTVRGRVTMATPATRQQSGVIDIVFDQLTLPNGTSFPIQGKLTSTDSAERRQINADPNNSHVVLVGERGGIGAAIAGAGSNASNNSIFAALGSLLSEGRDVSVPTGTPLAVELENSVSLRGGARLRGIENSTIYTAMERVRAAQQALAQLNYYRGPLSGQLDDNTRQALFQYQVDRGLSATGNLDGRTARSLGINLGSGTTLSGSVLTSAQAAALRRDAQTLLARERSDLGASGYSQLNANRAYAQTDVDLWFALSAFADNAAIYEQIVSSGSNRDAAVLAGRSLANAARRVDAAMQNARTTNQVQNAWMSIRRQMTTIDTGASTTE
jgi:peptidoglycan hydrolase-like protein with peptidoglycan-binding domain